MKQCKFSMKILKSYIFTFWIMKGVFDMFSCPPAIAHFVRPKPMPFDA